MLSTIRFLKPNRYRHAVGSTDSLLGYGVQQALVDRGIAEWVQPLVASGMSQPVAVTETPKRRTKRIDSFEE